MAEASVARNGRDYPVKMIVQDERAESRFWGHPVLGVAARLIALIPHLVWIALIALLGLVWMLLVGWMPILFMRRVPDLQAEIYEELVHRGSRVSAYLMLLPGYPPLAIGQPGPVDVWFDFEGRTISRWWGIPVVGPVARLIALVPHFVVLLVLGLFVAIVWLTVWIPIFLHARIPDRAVKIFSAYLRYGARVASYAFLLPVPYPPFSLR
jgi:hypothetical protein